MKRLLTHRQIWNSTNYVELVAESTAAEPLTIYPSTQTTSATFHNRRLCIIGHCCRSRFADADNKDCGCERPLAENSYSH